MDNTADTSYGLLNGNPKVRHRLPLYALMDEKAPENLRIMQVVGIILS